MEEIWKDIIGYEGRYQISNFGRVKSLLKKHRKNKDSFMDIRKNKGGYLTAGLRSATKKANPQVHRLVAIAFIQNPESKPQVNHIDGNKENNYAVNLEWVTASENIIHAFKTGLRSFDKLKQQGILGNKVSMKPVLRYNLDGSFVKEWESTIQIQRTLKFPNSNICECLKGRYKQSHGYIWKYKNP